MRGIRGIAATLAALFLVLAGCSGSKGSSPETASTGEVNPWEKAALWVEHDGKTEPFENGTAVTVGDINVEVFVAPYPPSWEGSIDLYVTEKATGKPLEGSGPAIIFDMYMPHGSIKAEALPTGGGHYLVPYKLVMPGEWRVNITISRSRELAALALIFQLR